MKEKKILSKKQVRFRQGISICLFVATFASVLLWDYVGDHDIDVPLWLALGITFGLMLGSLVVAMSTFRSSFVNEAEEKIERYKNKALTQLPVSSARAIQTALETMGFERKNGYWYKRQFNWARVGFVHYYAGFGTHMGEIKWLQTLDEPRFERKCLCVVVFLTRDQLTVEDDNELRNIAIDFMLDELIIPKQISNAHTCVPALLDESERKGWYLGLEPKDRRWHRNSAYELGCRLLSAL